MQLFEGDLLGCRISLGDGGGQPGCCSGDAQHTASVGDEGAVLGDGRAGVVDGDVLPPCQLAVGQAGDGLALFILDGIAAGSQDDTGGGTIGEPDLGVGQRTIGAGRHDLQQVALQQRQHDLRFRVAKAAVVLDDLRAVRGEHEAEVEAALERAALGVHGPDGGQEDLLHALGSDGRGVVGVRGHGAHAAGVQAGVVVVGPLVVHAGHHGLDHLAVGEAQHTDLRAGEELFDHDMVAGSAELLVQHDLLHAVGGLLLVLTDEHTLAQSQTICLDDDRVLSLGPDVVHDLGRVVKRLIPGGGNAVFLHQVFGEDLGSLDAGRCLVRAESRDTDRCQRIDHAQSQRVVLRDDDVIELFLRCKRDHGVHIGGLDVLALGVIADAAVAGCAPDLAAVRALLQCLDDGVLTSAAAND